MIIKHEFKNKIVENQTNDPGFLITNRNGSYYSWSSNNSRYDGFFIYEKNEMYKIIDEILLHKEIVEIKNKFSHISLNRNNLNQDIFMFKNLNSLICLFDKFCLIELLLDVKRTYDNRNFGYFYNIVHENNKIIIRFDKKTSSLEHEADGNHEYSIFIVINQATFSIPNTWIKKSYSYDKYRNSLPYERHVYHGLKLLTNKLIISASTDKKKAINENNYVLKNLHNLISKNEKYVKKLVTKFNHRNKKIDFTFKSSVNALDQLTTDRGIFAGLPWFFQYWTRDELISVKSLNLFDKNLSKQIINKHVECLIKMNKFYNNLTGKDCSKPMEHYAILESKDGLGLLVTRSYETKNFNYKLINYLRNCLNNSSLIENKALETWMDTKYGNDDRSGFRIEIQALYLKAYSILYKLTKDKKFKILEENLKKKVRDKFFTGKILKDGVNDSTIRPNIFLAYYFYPEFLSKKEWIKVFDSSIPNIWNKWGGFSSIEKSSPLFQPNYTGENNLSYHRGDSWFFLNNLAAICLSKLNKNKYRKYINKILEASIHDILWQGYIGFHSEISSSSNLTAGGCKAQAWSSALFIELINESKK